jgi:hypothetical protein
VVTVHLAVVGSIDNNRLVQPRYSSGLERLVNVANARIDKRKIAKVAGAVCTLAFLAQSS